MRPRAARACRALDDLYGAGRGEGSRGIDAGRGGGREEPFPTAREWADELDDVFGDAVRDEVLGRAVERGRAAAALVLDPDRVAPSVELLEQVLSLKGGLSEAQLGRLRRLIRRVVDDLVRELAVRVRPALTGLAIARPTRRPGGPLDLRRTVAANLKTARVDEGGPSIVPERLYFKTRARRSMDWRVILVVDVSGSMEASVIYSAMMAAILNALPAVSAHFVAFNTEVVDLTDRVDDPLGLLLEVSVGGGTHIARALAYARELMKVPARTLVVLVTDFEEGWPVEGLLAEVRAIAESGAKPFGLAALDDRGAPRFNRAVAEMVAGPGMPVAALTPLELARWVGEKLR
jgi:Mg-chelatase subunit ChlD